MFLKSSSCRVSNLISKRVTFFFPLGALSLVLVFRDKTIFHTIFSVSKEEKNKFCQLSIKVIFAGPSFN